MPGSTPLYGFPYPTYTDPADLAGQLTALAHAVDDRLETEAALSTQATARPSGKATSVAPQGLVSGVLTTLTYTTEVFDNSAMVNLGVSTSDFTLPVTGLYLAMGSARFQSNSPNPGAREVRLQVNGSSKAMSRYGATNTAVGNLFETGVTCVMLVNATAGSTLRMSALQDSGGALNVTEASLSATRIA